MIADVIVLAIIIVSAYFGKKRGLIKTGSKIICFGISFVVAKLLYEYVYELLKNSVVEEKIHENVANKTNLYITENSPKFITKIGDYTTDGLTGASVKVLSVIAIVIITYVVARLILKAINIIAKLPGISLVNKLGGLVLGIVVGLIISYLIISVSVFINKDSGKFWFDTSVLASSMCKENILMNFIIN